MRLWGLTGPSRKKILFVDDDDNLRHLVEEVLSQAGYEVESAVDGLEGLRISQKCAFDLVILDINMPKMGGLQFLEALRSLPRHKNVPVIIMSSESRMAAVEDSFKFGVKRYITKPFSPKDLVEKVGAFFA